LHVFKDLTLLFFCAAEVLILFLVEVVGITRCWHPNSAQLNIIPVDVLEESMLLDLKCATDACTQTFAWVSVEEMDNQVFSFLGHADGEF
jgi:hypothetical protein